MQWHDPSKFVPPRQEGSNNSILVLVADEYYQPLMIGYAMFDEEKVYWMENDTSRSVIHHPASWTFLPLTGKTGDPVEFPPVSYIPVKKGEL